jgi:oligopeptide/dipeptide ABC transporter ATP-binding protein
VPEIVLEAHELSKSYGGRPALGRVGARAAVRRPALDRVSVRLERGEVLGVVGESGSGKTTLARCLTMLVRPDTGRVMLEGRDLSTLSGRALRVHRRRIQVIFQDPYASLNPRLPVGKALEEVLHVHHLVPPAGVARRVAELLDLVGLPARAAEPTVLVADEAVSALDVSIQAQVINLLLSLRERLGLSIVFISHDLHVVRRVAPKIVVMFGGRIVEMLPPDVPLEAAKHPYTRALVAAVPRLDAMALPEIEAREVVAALPPHGCPFRDRCRLATDLCAAEDPSLAPSAGGVFVACHHAGQAP